MVINKIRIKNFRSIVDETIYADNFNCFVGKNDSGKSNVLKALNLFFNNKTDFNTDFDFNSDYSKFAKRSAKQAKEIVISIDVIVPKTYKENGIKTWTKVWRADGLHDDNKSKLFKSGSKGFTFLDRINYLYIPAVKSTEYFKDLLSSVYDSMTKSANSALRELNGRYSKQLQDLTSELSAQLKNVLDLSSAIQMPPDLSTLFRDLTFITSDEYVKGIDISHRGDGIKARHIPSILRYIQKNTEDNRPKNSVSGTYIWGFEEPENGVEYLSCFEMADELLSYSVDYQLFLTTHSPAFYSKVIDMKARCYFVYKEEHGWSQYATGLEKFEINERIGVMPLVTPYIVEERARYIKMKEDAESEIKQLSSKYKEATGKVILITEGKTDTKHIKVAFEQLNLEKSVLDRIEYYDFSDDSTIGEQLGSFLVKLSKIQNVNKIIGVFDRDKHVQNNDDGKEYQFLGNNVYRFNIPAISNSERKETDAICIEHYYSNSEIETRTEYGHIYMGKDFNEFGVSNDSNWHYKGFAKNPQITSISIIDSSCKHIEKLNGTASIISKDDFANYVIKNPEKFNFENFRRIYEVIQSICADT